MIILFDSLKIWRGAIFPLTMLAPFLLMAGNYSMDVDAPSPPETGYFRLGTTRNPDGHEVSVNSRSILFDGQPVLPAMGEFHYARVPEAEWRDELLKVKAGGISIVSTYVFWIHHEEIQGQWNWRGQRNLRKFIQTCQDLGLKVILRCGPWSHGEVRNGGFPDWIVAHKDWKLRSTDTNFLAATGILYHEIAGQISGLLWKDGGPVIGIQLDNEYAGSSSYLMALKQLAMAAGLDVPLYTKTGWPALKTPLPVGELLPMFGGYPDGFWSRNLRAMDGAYWQNFTFKITRTDTTVGNDTLKVRQPGDTQGTEKYPYLTCEIGGGMPASYHMRLHLDPRDIESVVLCRLGSGSSLLGYYMYHGGQNPDGELSTLQESTATGYANDLPVKSYDFDAPIGEFGQINPQYYWLRRLHLFLGDFGSEVARMPATLPTSPVTGKSDTNTLRWSVRSDGRSGFVFVNNYQRGLIMPEKTNVQFRLNLVGEKLDYPQSPVTIPADAFFFWPFNMELDGARLKYATAQPICREGDTFYFAAVSGMKADFMFDTETLNGGRSIFKDVKPSRQPGIQVVSRTGKKIEIILLTEADSLVLAKSAAGKVQFDAPTKLSRENIEAIPLRSAGSPRAIPLSSKTQLAIAPTADDFTNAAVWKIELPTKLDLGGNPLLRVHYVGDVARLTLNGRLVADNFYAGREFDLGLKRYGSEILSGDLRLEILPLQKDAPVYIEPSDQPDFGTNTTVLKLDAVQIIR